jgi:large subunit ribosomal protein L21e
MSTKGIREKGKIKLSNYFQELNENDRVAIVREPAVQSDFPQRLVGKSGKVIGSRGRCKLISLEDGNKLKTIIVHPVHLKKLK